MSSFSGMGMILGAGAGLLFGPLLGDAAPFGLVLGAALGLFIGSIVSRRQHGQHDQG